MKELKVTKRIDWYTASYSHVMHPHGFDMPQFDPIGSLPRIAHYERGWLLQCGAKFYQSDNPQQGCKLEISGEAWNSLYAQLGKVSEWDSGRYLIKYNLAHKRHRVTRIDYALTLHDMGKVEHIVNHVKAGKYKSSAKKPPVMIGEIGVTGGKTVYFGDRRQSPQFVRIYDKGRELGMLSEAILRVEMVTKKQYAEAMTTDIIRSGVPMAGDSRLATLLDFPKLRWWDAMMKGEMSQPTPVPRKETKWEKWMSQQVAPSVKNHMLSDYEFVHKWLVDLLEEFGKVQDYIGIPDVDKS